MDSVNVLREASPGAMGAGLTPQVQNQTVKPKKSGDDTTQLQPADNNCHHRMPTKSSGSQDDPNTDADRVWDDFLEKINLKSEHCSNGLISNNNTQSKNASFSLIQDERLLNENDNSSRPSPCQCLNVDDVKVDCYESDLQEVMNTAPSESASTSLGNVNTPAAEEFEAEDEIVYSSYESELQMPDIMRLIQKDLSEPYSIYTYRYFIHNWPSLCFLARIKSVCVGAIVCKLDIHRKIARRGYIAMLAVDEKYRKRGIGSNLVLKAIAAMVADDADEVVLETEITNRPALRLYENLGFVRDKRLFRYYLNGVDALRLKLWLR